MDISDTSRTDLEILAELGRRLAALREALGLNQTQAAERAGVNRSTVSRAELGDNPTLRTLVRLLRVYGRLDALESFIPVADVSPMALVREARKGQGRQRRESDEEPRG